jgi:RNA polymerase sigma-70 factor (ECF subfamily)
MNDPRRLSEELLATLHDEAFRWAASCCDYDRQQAEDVMQAVYVEILGGRARFRGESSLRTWLFAVIRRIASNHARRHVAAGRLRERLEALAPADEAADDTAAAAHAARAGRALLAALTELPARQRLVLELVCYRDLTLEEAAAVLGIGIGSARTHYHRAKKRLAARLADLRP